LPLRGGSARSIDKCGCVQKCRPASSGNRRVRIVKHLGKLFIGPYISCRYVVLRTNVRVSATEMLHSSFMRAQISTFFPHPPESFPKRKSRPANGGGLRSKLHQIRRCSGNLLSRGRGFPYWAGLGVALGAGFAAPLPVAAEALGGAAMPEEALKASTSALVMSIELVAHSTGLCCPLTSRITE